MSGVYIKGMQMPDGCPGCYFKYVMFRPHVKCNLLGCVYKEIGPNGRLPDCPLIPVPDHGRLIDSDALPLEENVPTVMMYDGEKWLSAYELAMAPTIIPADKKDPEP